MTSKNFLEGYLYKKEEVSKFITSVRQSKMVLDAITPLLSRLWRYEPFSWYSEIDIVPENRDAITIEDFRKLTSKIAKAFSVEPTVYVDERQMLARFFIYPTKTMGDSSKVYGAGTIVEIRTSNSEKCEITYKRKMQKVPVLSGYCKALTEKQDWAKVN